MSLTNLTEEATEKITRSRKGIIKKKKSQNEQRNSKLALEHIKKKNVQV